jgi:energy-coupling factor transporter ATP-binding protein EcfA2/uncharacterized membrane protein
MEFDTSVIYTIEHLSFRYKTGAGMVLHDISTTIAPGEFIVLCGPSGCGKTTLLRQLKSAIAPHGTLQGRICFHGQLLSKIGLPEQAAAIGYVSQNPETQIVTDKVWHELAFGLESLGMDSAVIQRRIAEMSQFFGIQTWFHKNVYELSGGQKQLLNLASVMVMQPEILLLDEPTSQLDPIAATEFVTMLHRIHQELGTTILMTEHRLEEVLPYATRMMLMEQGQLTFDGDVQMVMEEMQQVQHPYVNALPASVRIWNALDYPSRCPVTVQEGREWIRELAANRGLRSMESVQEEWMRVRREAVGGTGCETSHVCTLELKHLWFRYEKETPDVLRDVSLQAYAGEVLAVLGGNGSGKSTMLSVIYGGRKPQRGKVRFPDAGRKRVVSLPQNPQLLFACDTVREELLEMLDSGTKQESVLEELLQLCQLEHVLSQHPYDLSGGEQQRLGLAKVLLAQPDILLLDEPTKGLDIEYKVVFADILRKLKQQGITILMVSHDVEFCASYADRCALFFDGQIASQEDAHTFFTENHFYTTQAHRMARQQLPKAVTVEEVILACGGHLPVCRADFYQGEPGGTGGNEQKQKEEEQKEEEQKEEEQNRQKQNSKYAETREENADVSEKKQLSPRLLVCIAVLLLAIPVTLYAGIHLFHDTKYLFIALLILVEAMLPFFLAFEGKKPPARDVVILAVLCAVGIAGRVVCAAVPQFQPVTAIAIIAGAAYGGEAGFLTGAITMLTSNMLLGQGPWTPWQMFAMGMIGFFAGVIFHPWTRRGSWERKQKTRIWLLIGLCSYGFLAVMLLYGGIMNPAAALMSGVVLDYKQLASYYISGIPFDLIHAVSTVVFLIFGAMPILKKLERISLKFGD